MRLDGEQLVIESPEEGKHVAEAALLVNPFGTENEYKGDGWRALIYSNLRPEDLPKVVGQQPGNEQISKNAIEGLIKIATGAVESPNISQETAASYITSLGISPEFSD